MTDNDKLSLSVIKNTQDDKAIKKIIYTQIKQAYILKTTPQRHQTAITLNLLQYYQQ